MSKQTIKYFLEVRIKYNISGSGQEWSLERLKLCLAIPPPQLLVRDIIFIYYEIYYLEYDGIIE